VSARERAPRLPVVPGGAPEPGRAPEAPADASRVDLRDEHLHALLVAFYDEVGRDAMLAPYFAPVDMTAHMPRIVDFWSTILFHTGRYSGNAFRPHAEMPGLTGAHFGRWLSVLERVVDARFAGQAADRLKDVAHRVAFSMQIRLGIAPFAASV